MVMSKNIAQGDTLQKGDIKALSQRIPLVKALVANFATDAKLNGYELTDEDTPFVTNLVLNITDNLFKASQLDEMYFDDFLKANEMTIRSEALKGLDQWHEQTLYQKSMADLTLHPVHIQAHDIEDKQGGVFTYELCKSRWPDLPEELREHLEQFHGPNKVFHVHVESNVHPLVFGKSVDTYNLERFKSHEMAHRLDEKALRGDEATEQEWEAYHSLYKGQIYAGMVEDGGQVITPELAEHINEFHGPNYKVHALELPMIGPSDSWVQHQNYIDGIRKSRSAEEANAIQTSSKAVDDLRGYFSKGYTDGSEGVHEKADASADMLAKSLFQRGPFNQGGPTFPQQDIDTNDFLSGGLDDQYQGQLSHQAMHEEPGLSDLTQINAPLVGLGNEPADTEPQSMFRQPQVGDIQAAQQITGGQPLHNQNAGQMKQLRQQMLGMRQGKADHTQAVANMGHALDNAALGSQSVSAPQDTHAAMLQHHQGQISQMQDALFNAEGHLDQLETQARRTGDPALAQQAQQLARQLAQHQKSFEQYRSMPTDFDSMYQMYGDKFGQYSQTELGALDDMAELGNDAQARQYRRLAFDTAGNTGGGEANTYMLGPEVSNPMGTSNPTAPQQQPAPQPQAAPAPTQQQRPSTPQWYQDHGMGMGYAKAVSLFDKKKA